MQVIERWGWSAKFRQSPAGYGERLYRSCY